MSAFWILRILLSLPLALLIMPIQSCGAPPERQLLSVSISPTAGAPGVGSDQVQFVATGYYNTEPYVVTPLQADWGACAYPLKVATVTQDGLATCAKGASGTISVEAWVINPPGAPVCNVVDCAGRSPCSSIGAAAQLTCP